MSARALAIFLAASLEPSRIFSQEAPDPRQLDPDPAVRLAAVAALIDTGGGRSAEMLRTSCRDGSGEIQRLAIAGLVNFYIPGYVKKGVHARLNKLSDKIMRNSGEVAIDPWIQIREADGDAILGAFRDPKSPEAKLEAARALGTLRFRKALPDLYPLLKSKDDALMLAALRAIENSGEKAAAQETVFLLRDLNNRIQLAAVSINGLARNEGALADLAEVFARNRSAKSRAAALEAIAMIGSPESEGLFRQNLDDKDPAVRGYAAEGLGRIGAREQQPVIEARWQEESAMRARLGQAFALVQMGNREEAEASPLTYLFNTLNSAFWNGVARAYLQELARHDDIRSLLRAKIAEATSAEKIGLAAILAKEGTRDDLAALEALAHDKDPNVAQEGIKATKTLGARLP